MGSQKAHGQTNRGRQIDRQRKSLIDLSFFPLLGCKLKWKIIPTIAKPIQEELSLLLTTMSKLIKRFWILSWPWFSLSIGVRNSGIAVYAMALLVNVKCTFPKKQKNSQPPGNVRARTKPTLRDRCFTTKWRSAWPAYEKSWFLLLPLLSKIFQTISTWFPSTTRTLGYCCSFFLHPWFDWRSWTVTLWLCAQVLWNWSLVCSRKKRKKTFGC